MGGHGYLAASLAAELPALSVPSVGGPVVPASIVNFPLYVPWALGVNESPSTAEQLTGMALPAKLIVG